MSFETNPMFNTNLNEAQELSVLLGNLIEMLRAQRDILQQRGMNLPLGTLKSLQDAQQNLDHLSARMGEQQIELNQLRALAETSGLINSTLELDEVLNRVMDTVVRLTGAERGYIVLRDPNTGQMEFRIARNLDQETIEQGSFIISRSVVNKVAETGDPIVTTNAQSDPRFADQESVVSYALRSVLCVPLKAKGKITGVVYADNRIRAGLFGDRELELLSAFANQAAVAIENAQLFEQVRATLNEITAYEQLLENVFASIASGVITTDVHDNVIIYNRAAEAIFGVPTSKALNAPISQIFAPLGEQVSVLMRRVREHNTREHLEVQPVTDTRGKLSLDMMFSPLKNHEEQTEGVTVTVDDRTEISQREATLTEVRRYLPPEMVKQIREIDAIELGGVVREISAIFADVRGFTSFSESLQPEGLMEIINKYLTVSSDAIHLYEGIIDKYMGDAVVGLYNTQLNPQEDDHALRAVRAAMSMIYDVQALHEVLEPDSRLWYGIGIDTGPAVLGNVGSADRKEFTALGRPLDYAKKLQEAAERGEIIISEATYQRVSDRVEAERVERPFRGETELHTMYKVLGFKRTKR